MNEIIVVIQYTESLNNYNFQSLKIWLMLHLSIYVAAKCMGELFMR